MPSSTCPTSRTRIGAPPTFLTMMLLNSSTCSTRPSVRTPSSVGPANDASAGRFDVFGLDRALDVLRAQVVGVQLVEIEEDVDLAIAAAADVDAADAIHRLHRAADLSCRRFRSARALAGCR